LLFSIAATMLHGAAAARHALSVVSLRGSAASAPGTCLRRRLSSGPRPGFNNRQRSSAPAVPNLGGGRKEAATGGTGAADVRPRRGDPFFRQVWRQFSLRVHPDLFSRYPDVAARNSEALQRLQGILSEVKSGDKSAEEMMKPRTEELEFFVRTEAEGTFMRVPLRLRLPGGHCPDALAAGLAPLFAACKLPTRFHWGPEFFQSRYVVRDLSPEERAEMEEYYAETGGRPEEEKMTPEEEAEAYRYANRRQHKRWA
jgi:hypothetical protein